MSEKRVVVLGGGFGGLSFVKALNGTELDITLVDKQNHHLFQPLLYQVATAGLAAPDIAEPLRMIFSKERNRLMTTVVIGAGPTGVEMAGTLAELAHRYFRPDFRKIDPKEAKGILVDVAKREDKAAPSLHQGRCIASRGSGSKASKIDARNLFPKACVQILLAS